MKSHKSLAKCQLPAFQNIAVGYAKGPPESLIRRLKLAIRRRLTPRQERTLRRHLNNLMNRFSRLTGRATKPSAPTVSVRTASLKAGDRVRVRSREEVEASLDHLGQLKGCSFMAEMWPYCDTTQRVLKRLERFIDERDLRAKKCKGIVLLEGLMCQGTAEFGRCDRSCFYFWREEWLEKIDG